VNVAESINHAAPERRATPRTRLQKLAYIHVEPDNGVIVLDVSDGGIRFCAATALADTDVLRLQLSLQSNLRVAVTARLIWMDPTMKSGGLQFDALPAGGLERVVHDWLDYSGLPTHAGKTIAPPPPLPSIPILATIPPSPRAANVPAVKALEPDAAKAVEVAATPAAVVEAPAPAPADVKVQSEGNAPAAKPSSPEKKAESAPDTKRPEIAQIPAPSATPAVPTPLVADVPATKASEPPATKAAPPGEAVAARPLLRQPGKKQLPPPPPPAAIPAVPQPQAAPAAPAVADRASATSDSAPAVVKTPQPTAPPKTAVIVPQSRPAPNALRKISVPAPRPIVASANASLAKKTAPKEFIGFAVAALLFIAILISLPAIFRNKPASSDALASASVANPSSEETPAAAPDANSQPVAPAQNPSRAYKPASASDLAAAAEPKSPNVGSPAAPASGRAANAASTDSAFAAKNAAAASAKADASSDPAAARDLRASTPAAGFGAPVAVPLSGVSSAPRDAVRTGEFNSVSVNASPAAPNARLAPATPAAALEPAVIFDKPSPAYTEEARRLAIEGEVTLEVIFSGTGQVQVLRVARGLGHGLDESAVSAAQQIRFRPAMQNGQPVDFPATLHITFQLAF
jgi:TonB family protein